jgi:hypothetical protein
MTPDRLPPHSVEAEAAVLGAMLSADHAADAGLARLGEDDFYRPAHRTVFAAVRSLRADGHPADAVTVVGALQRVGALADVGGGPFLHTLVAGVPTVANLDHYAEIVADLAKIRRIIDLGYQLVQVGREHPADAARAVADARAVLDTVSLPSRLGGGRPFSIVDLADLAKAGIPEPELLCSGLLYRSGLHALAGPPDCGKSTLAYWWALRLLAGGDRVVLVDEESGREQVVEKLLDLGAEPHHLERLIYVEFPGRSWDDADRLGLAALLAEQRPALVIFDSSAAFLTLAGLDEDRAPGVTAFYKLLLDAARSSGAAVVVIDHVTKDGANGGYARGSGAKKANVDVLFMLDPLQPFSRRTAGLLKLTVTKDRRGYLHREHEIRVEVEGGPMALAIERAAPAADPALEGLAPAARKVLEALRASPGPLTNQQIGDWVADRYPPGLRRPTISKALTDVCHQGLAVEAETGPHGVKRWEATNA